MTFDIIINLNSGKKYQAPISLDIPTDEIIEKGTVGIDKTDLQNIIFIINFPNHIITLLPSAMRIPQNRQIHFEDY